MFLSSQLRNDSPLSARLSESNKNTPKLSAVRNYSNHKVDHSKNSHSKIQFRKVIIQRGKNSRVKQDQPTISKLLKESRVSVRSSLKDKRFFPNESNAYSLNELDRNLEQQIQRSFKYEKSQQQIQKKKFSFIQKLGNAKLLKQIQSKQDKIKFNSTQQKSLQESKLEKPRNNSVLSNKQRQQTFKFIREDLNTDLLGRIQKQDIKSSRIIKKDKQSVRPSSSASNKSSISQTKIYDHREDMELTTNQKTSRGYGESQRSFHVNAQKKEKQQRLWTWQQIIEDFDSTEKRINLLIEEKWNLIEEKLTDQKQSLISKEGFQNNKIKRRIQSQPLSRLNKKSQTQGIKNQHIEKYTFSKVVREKNLDLEVMNQIKKLRQKDFSKGIFPEQELMNQQECQSIKQRLEQRRSQIIEKALAESMVEAQLLKKYYSGQNYNGLSTSNYKVGQQNAKQKLILKLKTNKSTLLQDIKRSEEQRGSDPRYAITKQSENQIKFNKHKEEDYEKFRYKHPNYKPNLQPIPQTSYRSQFFSYGNFKAYEEPHTQEQNIIFPKTNGLRNSSYRSQFKQMSPDRINFKQLDAYRDKYKELNILYIPKKRSESETNALKKKKSQNIKFVNQLEYVKRLKTQSLIEKSRRNEIAQKVAKQMLISESRKQYQNPEKIPQYYMKSQIKHKNLFTFKYDFKKKVHA